MYAQSSAIYRFLAKKGHLTSGGQGEDEHNFLLGQMLCDQHQDLYSILAKPYYVKDDAARAAAWGDAEKSIHAQYAYLEKLIGANGQFSSGNRLLMGDILMVCAFNIVEHVFPNALDGFAKLKAFYAKNREPVLGDLDKVPPYFVKK